MIIAPGLNRAIRIVQQYDPSTYAQMSAMDWNVYDEWEDTGFPIYALFMPALGVTSGLTTLIKPDVVDYEAAASGVPSDYLAATVLVHEFDHARRNWETGEEGESVETEISAFAAGSAFALKLPPKYGQPIYIKSEDNRKHEISEIQAGRL